MNYKNFLVPFLAIAFFLFMVFAGFLIYQNSRIGAQLKNTQLEKTQMVIQIAVLKKQIADIQTKNSAIPVTIEDKTTSKIDTSNWLTYKNTKYGYEFKYPETVGSRDEYYGDCCAPLTSPESDFYIISDPENTFEFQIGRSSLIVVKDSPLSEKIISTFTVDKEVYQQRTGFIKNIFEKEGKIYLDIDEIQLLSASDLIKNDDTTIMSIEVNLYSEINMSFIRTEHPVFSWETIRYLNQLSDAIRKNLYSETIFTLDIYRGRVEKITEVEM